MAVAGILNINLGVAFSIPTFSSAATKSRELRGVWKKEDRNYSVNGPIENVA